jgi:hypothetical protein
MNFGLPYFGLFLNIMAQFFDKMFWRVKYEDPRTKVSLEEYQFQDFQLTLGSKNILFFSSKKF